MIRNITFTGPHGGAATPPSAPEETTLQTRKVTVSPAEEYQLRPGEVRPISHELAAAILSFKGRATIGNKGVVVDRKDIGGRFIYFHEDSVLINDFSAREKKYYYVINRLTPDILHLLSDDGSYIESLPLRERPAVLDTEAQAREVARNRTVISRAATRLQTLHAEDTREALATLQENSREMQRVVQTLPAPCAASAEPVQPARSTFGESAAAGTRRIHEVRANKASALALGQALAANRRPVSDQSDADTTPAEDWSSHTRQSSIPSISTPTPVEKW